jgi:hypothetical protein
MMEPDYDFLQEEAPESAAPEIQQEAAPEAQTVDETQVAVATPEVPTTPATKEETVPLAALRAEREKRQKYERELATYRQAQQQPAPNFYEAPEQHVQHVIQQERQHMTTAMYGALEVMARETYQDYDEVFAEVEQYVADNPAAVQQIFSSPNPAVAAYKFGKQLRALKEIQDPDAFRAKVEAEIRAKVEAEYKARDTAKQSAAAAIPPDLSAVRASKVDDVTPDDSLDSILASRTKR